MKGRITKLSVAGATCYAIWGCLHIYGGYNVFMLGDSVDPGMVRGLPPLPGTDRIPHPTNSSKMSVDFLPRHGPLLLLAVS